MKNISNQNIIFKDKKVLLRVDLNVPMKNGSITESSRIEKIIPTIKFLFLDITLIASSATFVLSVISNTFIPFSKKISLK